MIPLNNIKRYRIAYLLFFAISLAGCYSNLGPCKGCDAKPFAPDVNLRIVDQASRQDLFLGPHAKYNLSLLRFKHVKNGIMDSVLAPFKVDSATHLLNLRLNYQTPADTIAVLIGTLKPQKLVIYTSTLNNCCARVVVTEAHFNDSLVYMAPLDPVLLAKTTNRVTVPVQ